MDRSLAVLALLVLISGCGWLGESGDTDGFADDFAEFEENALADNSENDSIDATDPSLTRPELRLQEGDRFTLQKTVTRSLTQSSSDMPGTSESKLRLTFTIEAREVRDDRILMEVRYDRVQYTETIAASTNTYDSDDESQEVPSAMVPYRGLVRNGFGWWIGKNNRVVELVGFDSFVEQCVRNVPDGWRQQVLEELRDSSSENNLAEFVDESIGLLHLDRDDGPREGQSWDREREYRQPAPVRVSVTCTVLGVSEESVDLEVHGRISAADRISSVGPSSSTPGVQLTVRGGHTVGTCQIDPTTGLPRSSRIEQYMDILITLNDGTQIEQQKQIISEVETVSTNRLDARRSAPLRITGRASQQPTSTRIARASYAEVDAERQDSSSPAVTPATAKTQN